MASIFERKETGTWRVQFRRKGLKQLCFEFLTKEEAVEFVADHEEAYITDPKPYIEMHRDNVLRMRRYREFARKGNRTQ